MERTDGTVFLAWPQKVSTGTEAPRDLCLRPRARHRWVSAALASADGLRRGGYVVAEASGAPAVRRAHSERGTESAVALEARARLEAEGTPTRVVSLPSWFLFARQDRAYRNEVLPPHVPARVSVEAGSTFGWERWLGAGGHAIGIDHFGASAPAERLFEEFGFGVADVVTAARALLD